MSDPRLPVIHPGEFLGEILAEINVSETEFAHAIGVEPARVSGIAHGEYPVTAEIALLFGRAFEQSPHYWLNLQADYDLKTAEANIGERLARIHSFAAPSSTVHDSAGKSG